MATTTDYDAPRSVSTTDDSLQDLQVLHGAPKMGTLDSEDGDSIAASERPDADQSDEELSVAVIPMKADEFRCMRCYLVWHRSQQAGPGRSMCRDCS